MNILITGGSSYIAKKLIDRLITLNHHIYIITRNKSYSYKRLNTFNINLSKKLEKKEITEIFSSNKIIFDCLFHFAFCVITNKQPDNKNLLKKNIIISENIVDICKNINVKKFINISSMSVYDNLNINKLKKKVNTQDYNYSLSNIYAEKILNKKLTKIIKQLIHLRISNVFTCSIYGRGTVNALFKELKKRNSITVYDKKRRLSFVSINYLIDIFIVYLKNNKSGIYDIKETNMNIIDFAIFLKSKYGNKETLIRYQGI